jgi:hypothetical protein
VISPAVIGPSHAFRYSRCRPILQLSFRWVEGSPLLIGRTEKPQASQEQSYVGVTDPTSRPANPGMSGRTTR